MPPSTIETHRRRLALFAGIFALIGFALAVRLIQWQIVRHNELTKAAIRWISSETIIEPERGTIFDRNGRILAKSVLGQQAVGDPIHFNDRTPKEQEAILSAASRILGMPADEILKRIKAGQRHYAPVKASISITVAEQLKDSVAYPSIAPMPKLGRFYPNHALLAHALGFAFGDGNGIGIEGQYAAYLRGAPGQKLVEGSDYGKGLGNVPVVTAAQNGTDITLTLDLNIQYRCERELENALALEKTITGVIVILEPKTGAVLAMCSRPTFDLNDYSAVSPSVWNNPAVSDAWEPGSIFKILTYAAAVDANKIKATSTFVDHSPWKYHGITISNLDNKSYGTLTPAQALQVSSNVVAVQVADVLSTTSFYTYMTTAFGLGAPTDIDLPGEARGTIRLPVEPLWSISDLAAQSYGQGLAVTPIQMAAAVAAIANKGIMMRPYVVSPIAGVTDAVGGPGPLRRSVKAETAATMTDWLVSVIDIGVKEARVAGYRLAGKTGTALIPPPAGTYNPDETIASFVGYGPAEDAQFLILVRIDRPQVHKTGAEVAAPVFKSLAQWLLTYLKIPPAGQRAQR